MKNVACGRGQRKSFALLFWNTARGERRCRQKAPAYGDVRGGFENKEDYFSSTALSAPKKRGSSCKSMAAAGEWGRFLWWMR